MCQCQQNKALDITGNIPIAITLDQKAMFQLAAILFLAMFFAVFLASLLTKALNR